ncbi:M15 family metallopeptidase [Thalassotalea sp. LPB0316]|uniref:M15 family metallopeptidase n=1 Tax=Thalassotalea sp. LPB0316 TaxID=2769490 RepID=UPI0018670F35|nr:M15 family metallopeptidase [Thalassotalea sp. LPB0316]QOL27329.1 M15 family metallopeptidase [Thalassotalea sp. LPB0316]
MSNDIAPTAITGLSDQHICYVNDKFNQTAKSDAKFGIHHTVVEPLRKLVDAAKDAGFNLTIASGFRNFDRQLSIFNRKANGQLPVFDKNNQQLDISALSNHELLHAIMYFSALPGTSRHHWGTDFDFYDASLLPQGQSLALAPWEYQQGGYFYHLNQWLDKHALQYGFYRPYDKYRGGVAIEPWHFSYFPLAKQYQAHLSSQQLAEIYQHSEMLLKAEIVDNIEHLFQQYVTNVAKPPHV